MIDNESVKEVEGSTFDVSRDTDSEFVSQYCRLLVLNPEPSEYEAHAWLRLSILI